MKFHACTIAVYGRLRIFWDVSGEIPPVHAPCSNWIPSEFRVALQIKTNYIKLYFIWNGRRQPKV